MVHHPVTGQRCWFNQIAFLNEWTIDPEVREYLVDMYGADGLPFNTRFGNGEPIGEDVIQLLNQVYEENTVREPWQPGDLMLVDNIRTAHSREPTRGRGRSSSGWPSRYAFLPRHCDGRMTTNRPTSAGSATSDQLTVPPFAVISGGQVQAVLGGQEKRLWSWWRPPTGCTVRGFGEPAVVFSAFPGPPDVADYRVAGLHRRTNPG